MSEEFWKKWYGADELERLALVETLTGFKNNYSQASLLNSYLSDLTDFLEDFIAEQYNPALNE